MGRVGGVRVEKKGLVVYIYRGRARGKVRGRFRGRSKGRFKGKVKEKVRGRVIQNKSKHCLGGGLG